jgi:hypothetical protein
MGRHEHKSNLEEYRCWTNWRYSIGIARLFVLQLIKMSLIQYRSCTTGKDGPGGI